MQYVRITSRHLENKEVEAVEPIQMNIYKIITIEKT